MRGWVQACTLREVQQGVQKCLFVRATCRARNPRIVHRQFLPATGQNGHNRRNGQVVPVLHVFGSRLRREVGGSEQRVKLYG